MDIMKTKVCKNKHEVNTNDYIKEEKDIKRKYRINQYRNISRKQAQKLKEYQRNCRKTKYYKSILNFDDIEI